MPDSETNKRSFTLEQPQFTERLWLLFTGFVVVLIMMAAIRWMLNHPYGIHWDEANYLNEALRDIHKLHSGSLRQLGSIFIGGDTWRPPAFRLLALPLLAVFGFHTALARFSTLVCLTGSAWFLYLTLRRVASPIAGGVSVLVYCLSAEVISASIFFSTDGPLMLATSAMLYFLYPYWANGLEHQRRWIGLGVAIGLGLLSKVTFILIALPVLAFVLISNRHKGLRITALPSLFKAALLALIVAGPWWLKNFEHALRYAKFASEQPRNSLGAMSPVIFEKWLYTVLISLIGPGITILIGLVVLVVLRKIIRKKEVLFTPVHRATLLACACAGLPLVAVQLSGTNHLLRYLCPAVIPLAIAVGVLSEATGWVRSRAALMTSAALAVAQLLVIVAPIAFPNKHPVDPGFYNGGLPWRILIRFDQWDWKPLRDITQDCALDKPKISLLGTGRAYNPSQILYPWFAAGLSPSERDGFPEPLWLWHYEQGPLDWQKVMSSAGQSDIVLTAPDYVGQISDRQDVDNQYNREFAKRLAGDSRFQGPIRLEMGRFEPVEVEVFLKKSLVCHLPEGQVKRETDLVQASR